MTRSPIGQLALASAAIADVLAWIMLALVVALISAHGGWSDFARTVIGLVVIAAIGFGLLRPLVAKLLARHAADGRPGGAVLKPARHRHLRDGRSDRVAGPASGVRRISVRRVPAAR